ncbi:MAG: hypothetical protein AAF533_07185 [Acidobacteriota bacterium]
MSIRVASSCLLALLVVGVASATTLQEPPRLVDGQSAALSFVTEAGAPASGVAVTAVYRENAHASLRKEVAVGTTNAAGRLDWTPEQAGVVVLSWDGGSRNVKVHHDGTPVLGVIIAALAGLLLVGGSAWFFASMLRQPTLDESIPPST